MVRTYIKRVQNAIAAGDHEQASQALKAAVPVMDSMVGKGHLHKNKAARHKSRMTAQIKKLAS
jgi:small subunit ribosomal protein S20